MVKRIIFLLLFVCCGLTASPAGDVITKDYLALKDKSFFAKKLRPKSFVNGNCELKMSWYPRRGLNLQLIYTKTFPEKLVDYLNNTNSAKVFSAFYIIFLDDNGFELIKDMCYLSDFIIEGAGDKQRAIFRDLFRCDPEIYDRINSIVIDFSQ
jgi:hypothetical protein